MKNRKTYWFPGIAYGLSLLISLFWVALRVNHSGISKFLGADTNQSFLIMNLPVMVCIVAWIGTALAVSGLLVWKKRRWPAIAGFVIAVIMTVGAGVVIYFGARDYLEFIMVHFWKSLAVAAGLNIFALLLFCPVTGKAKPMVAGKIILLAAAVLGAVILGYQLRPCDFTYGAVVYAVEDDYQIVFSTSDNAMAWVEIDGESYYDLYAGSVRSKDRVHKVTVPQNVLDSARGYTVKAQQMIYRGPFGGYKGPVIHKDYVFRPVDSNDGLNYVSISDVHSAFDAAAQAAAGEKQDFLVLIGDLISMVETEEDCQAANKLAHSITAGQIPVIYARGNHEIKGEYAEELYKYVGSLNQGFAYTVTLGQKDVFALVLDMGEDHEDDWWEYYGTAKFDLYRQEQTQMLEAVLEAGSYREYAYRMAICHIPVVYVDGNGKFEGFRQTWTALLNQMDMDISLSGHKHKVWYFLPDTVVPGEALVYSQRYSGKEGKVEGGKLLECDFPAFLVGQRSMQQTGGTQEFGYTDYLCLHTNVDFDSGVQTSLYRNSAGETVPVEYPFACDSPVTQSTWQTIETPLKKHGFFWELLDAVYEPK